MSELFIVLITITTIADRDPQLSLVQLSLVFLLLHVVRPLSAYAFLTFFDEVETSHVVVGKHVLCEYQGSYVNWSHVKGPT